MDFPAVIGIVGTVAGLVFAVISITKTVPSLEWAWTPNADEVELWNNGPSDVTVLRAWVRMPGAEAPAASTRSGIRLDERLSVSGTDDYCKGAVLPQHRHYSIDLPVNRTLIVRYRARGPFGLLSRATVAVEGHV